MKLSSRFLLDMLFVVAGAFLTVVSLAWAASLAGWTAFGVFTAVTVIAAVSAGLSVNRSRRLGHGLIALVALWSLVAALVFSGTLLTWLVFAEAIALGVLALADLAAHEATTERIVHSIEVREPAAYSRLVA
jgi:hypothetical protein